MAAPNSTIETMRRSTRIRAEIRVRVRSLDPNAPFDLLTTTLIINAQGCGVQSTAELPLNLPVQLSIDDRVATGRTLNSTVIDAARNIYVTGIVLDTPGNFWALPNPPADWPAFTPNPAPAKKVHPFAKRRASAEPPADPNAGPAVVGAKPAPVVSPEEFQAKFDALVAEHAERARSQAAAEWEQWRADAIRALGEVRNSLAEKLSADVESWKQETARAQASLQALLKAGEERSRKTDEQLRAIETIAASAQADIAAAIQDLKKSATESAATRDSARQAQHEAARTLAEFQKLNQGAPATLEQFAGRALQSASADIQKRIATAVTTELQKLQSQIQQMSAAAGEQARSRMMADLETRQTAFAETLAARIAEFDAKENALRASADDLAARLARQTEEAMAALRTKVQEDLARHEAEVAERLAGHHNQLTSKAETDIVGRLQALQSAAEKALQDIEERGQKVFASRTDIQRAAEAAMEGIDARSTAAQKVIEKAAAKSVEQLKAGLEAGQQELESRLQQQAWEYDAQAEAAAARLQERLTNALQQIDSNIQQKRSALESAATEQSSRFSSEAAKIASSATASMTHERDRQVKSFREQLDSEFRQRRNELQAAEKAIETLTAQHQRVAADVANLEKTKSYIESLIAALPTTIQTQAQQHAAKAWDSIRDKSEKQLAEAVAAERERAASALREEIAVSAKRLREEMAAHAQTTATELHAKFADEINARREEVLSELKTSAAKMAEWSASVFAAEAQRESQRHLSEAEAAHETAMEMLDDELQRRSADTLDRVRTETEAIVGGRAQSLASAVTEASELAAKLRKSAEHADNKTESLTKQLEDAQKWLAAHTTEFQKTVHDAFLSAGGEIKGRVASAADTAEELIKLRSREALSSMDAAASKHTESVTRHAEEVEAKIRAMQNEAAASAQNVLQQRLAETLEVFRADAARLAESTIARWQAAMEDTLRSVPDLLKDKITDEAQAKSAGAGD